MITLIGGPITPAPTTRWDAGWCINPYNGLNSLRRYLCDTIDARLIAASGDPTENSKVFDVWSADGSTFTRNPSCWMEASAITCMTAWNNGHAVRGSGGGMLISPRHLVVATHHGMANGSEVKFVTTNNTVVTKTVSSSANVLNSLVPYGGSGNYDTDIKICLLDSDVPDSIGFARVLPTDWQDYLPNVIYSLPRVPLVNIQQTLLARVFDWSNIEITTPTTVWTGIIKMTVPTIAERILFYSPAITNDSGTPLFLVINGLPVALLTLWTTSGGNLITNYYSLVNAAMTSLGGGYQLTPIDLSGFVNFG